MALILFLLPKIFGSAQKATLFVHVSNAIGATMMAGSVTIDDVGIGKPEQDLVIPSGTVRVGFVLPGWVVEPRSVTIQGGGTARVELVARPLPARLTVITNPPGAALSIGGRPQGRAPVTLELAAQAYRIVVTRDAHVSKTVDVTLEPGETRTLSMDLTPVPPLPAPIVPAPPSPPAAPTFLPPPFDRGVTSAAVPLYPSPSRSSNPAATIPPDTEVAVLGRAEADESWLQVRTAGRTGFVFAAGTVEPWSVWAPRHTVSGYLEEVTPGLRATVSGRSYALNGVKQPDSGSVAGLNVMREALVRQLRGLFVSCIPQSTTRFECKTTNGNDIGEFYILNGAAVPGDGAPGYYFESQQGARAKKKGLWSE